MSKKTKRVIGAAVALIVAAGLALLLSPSASGQTEASKPLSFCVINGTWSFTESRVHSPVRVDDIKDTGLLLDITGPRAAADPTSPGSGGKVAGYIQLATPVLLKDITAATLDYVSSVGTAKPGYQLVVDRTPLDTGDGYDGILVGEPGVYGAEWWASKPLRWVGGPGPGANSGYTVAGTLAQFATFDADAMVTAVGFSLGTLSPGTEARGILKSLTFNNTTWSFAQCPKPPVTTTTTATSTTTTAPTSTTTAASTTTTTAASTTTTQSPTVTTTVSPTESVLYANCDAVRAALNRELLRGEPGYRAALDADDDGKACEVDIVPVAENTADLASTGVDARTLGGLGLIVVAGGGLSYLLARKRKA